MASPTENEIQINLIKGELAKKVKPSELTPVQKRQLIDALFEKGVAMHYQDPIVAIGDTVYGSGNASINGGGFFFGTATNVPVTTSAHVDFEIQL